MLAALALAAILTPKMPSREAWPRPPSALVDRVEQRLAGRPCIGALTRWHRQYAYALRRGSDGKMWPDPRVVAFWFIEAGHRGLPAGREIVGLDLGGIDDSQFRLAVGRYDTASGRIEVSDCGLNLGGR